MNSIRRFILSLGVLVMFSGVMLVAPVSAHGGSGSSNSGPGSSETESEGPDDDDSMEIEDHAHDLAEMFKKKARADVAEKRTQHQEQTHERRQKSCEARKANLERRMDRAVTQARKHKAVFDKIYTRVTEFYENKNLNVDNYDALVASVNTAQAEAEASVIALDDLDVNIDCTQQNVAEGVSAFRESLKTTRNSLKDYRKALVELIKSIKGASSSTSDNSDSTNQGDSSNE